jgi:hypothetical protein
VKKLKLQRETIRALTGTGMARVRGANRHEDDPTGTGGDSPPPGDDGGGGGGGGGSEPCCYPPTDSCQTVGTNVALSRNVCIHPV